MGDRPLHICIEGTFVHTRPEVTQRRRAGQLDAVSGLQTDERLTRDYERRMRLARTLGERLVGMWEAGG